MGRVLDGKWVTNDLGPDAQGRYVRRAAQFREELSDDGSTPFPAEPGRYVMYASKACGWTHRALLVRALRGLEDAFPVVWAEAHMGAAGWRFPSDPYNGITFAWELVVRTKPDYTGRASVPMLWDTVGNTLVSNESMDLIRSFDRACNAFATRPDRLWPDALDDEIRAMMDANYGPVNNGVYKAGFAASQQAHTDAVEALFDRLFELDRLLADRRWLLGDQLTMADIGLFPTIFRFDAVYHTHFKCNVARITDLDHLWDWTRALYQLPGVAGTCDLDHAKEHYYTSHESIHPRGYIPLGPKLDFEAPTRR